MLFPRKALLNGVSLGRRCFHKTQALCADDDFETTFRKWYFKICGYNKYGLLYNDLLRTRDPLVAEAVRRMPEDMQMQMKYRAIRANQLLINHNLLPKEEWTTFEDNHSYLKPYLDEVIKEANEIKEWKAKY